MTLYVIRHGIAEDIAPDGDDRSRRLTPAGRRKMRAAAAGLKALGLRLDVLLTSPFPRAAETAALVSEALGGEPAPQELIALEQGVAPAETVRALSPFSAARHVAIVGHEPGLSGVAALLLSGSADGLRLTLKKGAVVALEVSDLGRRADATLRWMLAPRQLRRLAR